MPTPKKPRRTHSERRTGGQMPCGQLGPALVERQQSRGIRSAESQRHTPHPPVRQALKARVQRPEVNGALRPHRQQLTGSSKSYIHRLEAALPPLRHPAASTAFPYVVHERIRVERDELTLPAKGKALGRGGVAQQLQLVTRAAVQHPSRPGTFHQHKGPATPHVARRSNVRDEAWHNARLIMDGSVSSQLEHSEAVCRNDVAAAASECSWVEVRTGPSQWQRGCALLEARRQQGEGAPILLNQRHDKDAGPHARCQEQGKLHGALGL
mmetsp:Transcript_90398/g.210324  ORF Transcript_90398/g.210324 Transcript_90398/m.210324 type:complete len:268 (-) Transcript_90398:483-1286(-)